MKFYSLTHLNDGALRQGLRAAVGDESTTTAKVVAFVAEFDARRLYREDAYPSMRCYCVEALNVSDDAACRRIHAARAARQFPAIFEALADGRLNLTSVNVLAPYLTPDNAGELLKAAFGKKKVDIERLLAERFPRSEMFALVEAIAAPQSEVIGTSRESGVNTLSCQPALSAGFP